MTKEDLIDIAKQRDDGVRPCPTCGFPVRVAGTPDFIGDNSPDAVCTISYEPALDARDIALSKPSDEPPRPGDLLAITRQRLNSFRQIVGLADAVTKLDVRRLPQAARRIVDNLRDELRCHGSRGSSPFRTLYICDRDGSYHPVEPFDDFPGSGVYIVMKRAEGTWHRAEGTWHTAYIPLGDVPAEDALTYAAAHVHQKRAAEALAARKEGERRKTFRYERSSVTLPEVQQAIDAIETLIDNRPIENLADILDIIARVKQGEVFSWGNISIQETVETVLNAIAEGELEA